MGEVVTGPSSLRVGDKVFMEIQEGETREGRFWSTQRRASERREIEERWMNVEMNEEHLIHKD